MRQIKCAPIHIIAARESLQGPGPGSIGSLAQLIQDANPGTTLESVDYPATLDNYDSSSREGTKKTTESLTSYAKACPCAQIVMLGYSQGAHVIGDTLCGGGEYLGIPKSPPVDKAVSDRGELRFFCRCKIRDLSRFGSLVKNEEVPGGQTLLLPLPPQHTQQLTLSP